MGLQRKAFPFLVAAITGMRDTLQSELLFHWVQE